jgi:hypothetical protein
MPLRRNADAVRVGPCVVQVLWKDGKVNAQELREHFQYEGRLRPQDAEEIVKQATALFRAEANLLEVPAPLTGASGRVASLGRFADEQHAARCSVWRHSRAVLRSDEAAGCGRQSARDELSVPGRLCRSRLLLGRVPAAALCLQDPPSENLLYASSSE